MESMVLSDIQLDYFWSKVDIKQDKNSCWEWTGARKPKGYGNVRINKKYLLAHRVSWSVCNFDIPDGYVVMHICDNPSCCNPSHLMLGTPQANNIDKLIKGRGEFSKNKAVGSRNTNAKLTDEKIIEIRSIYKEKKMNQYELAEKYDVSQPAIGCIVRNETWSHV